MPENEINANLLYGPTRDIDLGYLWGGNLSGSTNLDGDYTWVSLGGGIGLTLGGSYGTGHTSPNFKGHPDF